MKNLKNITYCLGWKIYRSIEGIFINQYKYIKDLIALARLEHSTLIDTQLEINVKSSKNEGELISETTYINSSSKA